MTEHNNTDPPKATDGAQAAHERVNAAIQTLGQTIAKQVTTLTPQGPQISFDPLGLMVSLRMIDLQVQLLTSLLVGAGVLTGDDFALQLAERIELHTAELEKAASAKPRIVVAH